MLSCAPRRVCSALNEADDGGFSEPSTKRSVALTTALPPPPPPPPPSLSTTDHSTTHSLSLTGLALNTLLGGVRWSERLPNSGTVTRTEVVGGSSNTYSLLSLSVKPVTELKSFME